MDKLVQIIYVSRSSFIPTTNSGGIEPNVARILAKSRVNNRKNGLVGVLYFGDGCFFQCLEGKETEIDKLYSKLQLDPRHTDLKLISRKQINNLSFTNWAMKYVPLEANLNSELLASGYKTFDPYQFDAEMTAKVLKLLQISSNDDNDYSAIEVLSDVTTEKQTPLLTLAFIFSVLALALSIFNLWQANS